MARPNISKFQESEIRRAAKAAHLLYLASADAEYAEGTQRLVDEATALGRVLKRDELMAHERAIFDAEFSALSRG